MAKLRCLDEDRERRYYWNEKKVQQIRNQMGESFEVREMKLMFPALFMEKRRTRLTDQKTNGKKGIPAGRVVKPKAPARIEVIESDSVSLLQPSPDGADVRMTIWSSDGTF